MILNIAINLDRLPVQTVEGRHQLEKELVIMVSGVMDSYGNRYGRPDYEIQISQED